MSYSRKKFMWTDALRLMLIKEVKRRPIIWSSSSNNFNNMDDRIAYQITKKLHEVSTGICELTVNHIKDEWKSISSECLRILNRDYELKPTKSSIWRFGNVLRFMLYAVTETVEGNAHAILYFKKMNIFCVADERDIVGVFWPFSNVNVLLKEKAERATIIKIGQYHIMLEKCNHLPNPKNLLIWNEKLTEDHILPDRFPIQRRHYSSSLMRKDDQIVYYDSGTYHGRENSVKNVPKLLGIADVGENNPFSSALQLLQLQKQIVLKQHLFHGIPSSTLSHVDFDLHRNRRERILHYESSVSYNRPIPERRAVAASFAGIYHNSNSTFSMAYSRAPTKVRKQAEFLNYNWDRLLSHLDNIRSTGDGLRSLVAAAKADIDEKLKVITMRLFHRPQSHAPGAIPAYVTTCEKEMKSVLVQTDKTFDEEDWLTDVGKVHEDEVYKYCSKEIVRGLVITSSHPTVFVRRLARHVFTREEISELFSDNVTRNQLERIRWIKTVIAVCYPRKKLSSMHESCLQALSGMADYENLLLELEKENYNLDKSERHSIPVKRMRLDDACSSKYAKWHEENKSQREYLLPQTLSRIKQRQRNAEEFAVKVAALLYGGDDDIQRPCRERGNQAKLTWLKEKVEEFYPADTMRNAIYQWSRCLDAIDSHANKLQNISFDAYDSGDEFGW